MSFRTFHAELRSSKGISASNPPESKLAIVLRVQTQPGSRSAYRLLRPGIARGCSITQQRSSRIGCQEKDRFCFAASQKPERSARTYVGSSSWYCSDLEAKRLESDATIVASARPGPQEEVRVGDRVR